MRRGFGIVLIACLVCFYFSGARAENISASEYRSRWNDAESVYDQEHQAAMKEEQRRQDIKLYLRMGREHLSRKEYPLAMVCFRDIVALEQGMQKEYTPQAQEYMRFIEKGIENQVNEELNSIFKEDVGRRKEGLNRIMDRISSSYFKKLSEKEERLRRKKIEEERGKVKDELKRRQLDLEEEVLNNRLELEKELGLKEKEAVKKRMTIDNILFYADDLIAKGYYADSIAEADKALLLDPSNLKAKEIKAVASSRMEKEKLLARIKEEELVRRSALEKQKQEEQAKKAEEASKREEEKKRKEERKQEQQRIEKEAAVHFNKGQELYQDNRYLEAIEEFKTVLAIDPDNMQAKVYLIEIKSSLKKASDALDSKTADVKEGEKGSGNKAGEN
jgi:tetratricopeptide (TPR) repeat protein